MTTGLGVKKEEKKGAQTGRVKLTVTRKPLLEMLQLVSSITVQNTAMPILQNLRLLVEEKMLEAAATDLEVTLVYRAHQPDWAKVSAPGTLVVPAEKFTSVIREMAGETLELQEEEGYLILSSGGDIFKVTTASPEEFPPLNISIPKEQIKIRVKDLVRLITLTGFASAREKSRYALNGIRFLTGNGRLKLSATDSRRLALANAPVLNPAAVKKVKLDAIVPLKGLAVLTKLDYQEEEIGLGWENQQLFLVTDRITLGTRLLDGQFPDCEELLPARYPIALDLETEPLLAAVKRAALMTSDDARLLRVSLANHQMVLRSHSHLHGEAQVDFPVSYEGEQGIDIGFNPDYLVDFLKLVKTDRITWELKDGNSAGVFRAGEEAIYLVMPVCLD